MNHTKYGKGRFNGPIFKLQPRNFDFNESKATEEEEFLVSKMKDIGVPGKYFLLSIYFLLFTQTN